MKKYDERNRTPPNAKRKKKKKKCSLLLTNENGDKSGCLPVPIVASDHTTAEDAKTATIAPNLCT